MHTNLLHSLDLAPNDPLADEIKDGLHQVYGRMNSCCTFWRCTVIIFELDKIMSVRHLTWKKIELLTLLLTN